MKRILVVEDERATQLRLASCLTGWGYEPVTANDGEEAWSLLQETDFQCVLSDWMMPRMTGLELVRKLRESEQEGYVYFILLTGKTDKGNLIEGMEAGADDFLTKPFDRDELRVRVRAGERIIGLERRLAERNRELSMFTSVASHDLREPLRTISSFLKLLERRYKGKLDAEADEYIAFVMDGARRMDTLISDLLDYAKLDLKEAPHESVDVRALCESKITSLRAAVEESGAVITCGPLPVVDANRILLSQLFQNLIGNSIKYRGEASPVVHIDAEKLEGGWWRFSVKDNGIGIPEDKKEVVFEPFRRLHGVGSSYEGSGVGLAICKKAVERHGGRIWVESTPGEGSTFFFTIPGE